MCWECIFLKLEYFTTMVQHLMAKETDIGTYDKREADKLV